MSDSGAGECENVGGFDLRHKSMNVKAAMDAQCADVSTRGAGIKVLLVVESTIGGVREHVHRLAVRLPKDRFEVHIACPESRDAHCGDDYFVDEIREAGIPVHVVPLSKGVNFVSDVRAYRVLYALCRRERFDIVHGHSSKGGFLGRMAGRRAGSRTVFTPHSFAFQMRCSTAKRALYIALERFAGRMTDVLIAVSESERRIAVEMGIVSEDRVRLIHNAVDPDEFGSGGDAERLKAALGLPSAAKVIGFTGRLAAQKAVDVLINAFAQVLPRVPDAHLLIVGSGELEQELKDQVNELKLYEHVHFLGHRRDVPQLLGVMDCFVLPSLYEGLAYSLLEAMAAGLPIIASRAPGNEGAIVDGKTGFLVPVNDVGAIAEQATRILTNNEIGRKIGQGARTAVIEEFSPGVHVDRHVAVYEALASSGISGAAAV